MSYRSSEDIALKAHSNMSSANVIWMSSKQAEMNGMNKENDWHE